MEKAESIVDYQTDGKLDRGSVHFMYRQFNFHKFYVLPTQLYLCVLYGSQNKQRLFPCTALIGWFL